MQGKQEKTLITPVKLQALKQQLEARVKRRKNIEKITLHKKEDVSVFEKIKAIVKD